MGFNIERLIGQTIGRIISRMNFEDSSLGTAELFILFKSGLAVGIGLDGPYELGSFEKDEIFNDEESKNG